MTSLVHPAAASIASAFFFKMFQDNGELKYRNADPLHLILQRLSV